MNTPIGFQRYLLAGVCAASALVAPVWAAPTEEITAQLDQPLSLPLGKSAQLGLTVKGSQPGVSQLPASSVTRPEEDAAPTEVKVKPTAFLRVVLPKHELTVGELMPVEIKAYFPADIAASLNGLPMLTSDAFALNKLSDNPEQTREVIDGQPYTVLRWSSALSSVKAGDYRLNLDLPVMVRLREEGKHSERNPFKDFFGEDSPFDGSAFDDFFSQVIEKPLMLHSDGAPLKIQPLPVQGRPTDFSGAVGKFEVSAEPSVARAVAGDPITLNITITGQGNFDRVATNGLAPSPAWKSYRPNARFKPADRIGFAGTKTFEQAIVPTRADPSEIPALSFSYFDPETRLYVTKTTSPIPIEITLGSAIAAASVPANAPATARSTDSLAPDHPETGRVSSLRPVLLAPGFLIGNALMVTVTAIGLLVRGWHQRRASDPARARAAKARAAVREALSAMDEAIENRKGADFFHAARKAVTEHLAERWSVPARRITPAEVHARLDGRGDGICALFERAGEVAYSQEEVTLGELAQWRTYVTQQLAHL